MTSTELTATGVATHPEPRLPRVALFVLAVVALGAFLALFRHTLIDDAFISMKYSAMLAEHGDWSFLQGRVSNTATSPLNVLTTAAVGWVVRDMPSAALLLATMHFALMLWLLQRISLRLFGNGYFGAVAFAALVTNCLLLSTLGLEGTLFTLLFIASIERFLADDWTGVAVLSGLVVLARPDGGLLGVLYVLLVPGGVRPKVRFIITAALVVAPWFLYSWIHLGSFVPDTLQIKMGQRGWGRGLSYATGLRLYLQRYPVETLWSFVLMPFAPLAFTSARARVRTVAGITVAYGIGHLAAYTVMGVPPYHWYYVNQLVPTAVAGALGVAALAERWRDVTMVRRVLKPVAAGLPAMGLLVTALRLGVPFPQAPIHTNWATEQDYRDIGLWLRDHVNETDVIFNVSEMGAVSFYSQRTIVNEFSDANITWGAIVERYPTLPLPARLAIDANFYWRRMQPVLPERSYTLIHLPVPDDGPPVDQRRVVKAWDTSTRWVPHARLYLLRAAAPAGAAK